MLRIGMIGSIGHNGYVFDGVRGREDVEIVGVAPGPHETSAERLAAQARRAGFDARVYDDYRKLLDASPEIVTVACHYYDHAAVAIAALARGVHAFMEKPIATTLEDFARLRKAYDLTTGIHLSCMLGLRYAPAFLTAWRMVWHGAIGEVRLMNAQKSYKLGERADFTKRRETYGGTIPWVGSHAIDWLRWFSGRNFARVYAAHSTRANFGHGQLEATALCQFALENEVLGSVTLDYLRPDAAKSHGDDRLRVVGIDGVVEVADGTATLLDAQGERELPLEPGRSIFGEFIDQVRGQGECLVSAEDAFATTRACLLARESADSGRVVGF